jgi:hypothetical protein
MNWDKQIKMLKNTCLKWYERKQHVSGREELKNTFKMWDDDVIQVGWEYLITEEKEITICTRYDKIQKKLRHWDERRSGLLIKY